MELSSVVMRQLSVQTMAYERGHTGLQGCLSKEPPTQPNSVQESGTPGANARRATEHPLQRLPAIILFLHAKKDPWARKEKTAKTEKFYLTEGNVSPQLGIRALFAQHWTQPQVTRETRIST